MLNDNSKRHFIKESSSNAMDIKKLLMEDRPLLCDDLGPQPISNSDLLCVGDFLKGRLKMNDLLRSLHLQ